MSNFSLLLQQLEANPGDVVCLGAAADAADEEGEYNIASAMRWAMKWGCHLQEIDIQTSNYFEWRPETPKIHGYVWRLMSDTGFHAVDRFFLKLMVRDFDSGRWNVMDNGRQRLVYTTYLSAWTALASALKTARDFFGD